MTRECVVAVVLLITYYIKEKFNFSFEMFAGFFILIMFMIYK